MKATIAVQGPEGAIALWEPATLRQLGKDEAYLEAALSATPQLLCLESFSQGGFPSTAAKPPGTSGHAAGPSRTGSCGLRRLHHRNRGRQATGPRRWGHALHIQVSGDGRQRVTLGTTCSWASPGSQTRQQDLWPLGWASKSLRGNGLRLRGSSGSTASCVNELLGGQLLSTLEEAHALIALVAQWCGTYGAFSVSWAHRSRREKVQSVSRHGHV